MPDTIADTSILEATFYGSLALFAVLERFWPRREDGYSFLVRWGSNFGLFALELLIAWVLLPGGMIVLAVYAQSQGWGLLNLLTPTSAPLATVATVLLLDLTKYWEHRLLHRVPWLWRMHVVHHADLDVDFTTTLRHHPFEVLFSAAVGVLAVIVLGLSPLGIFIFSLLAAVVTTMSHANIRWNKTADGLLRLFIMTRDAHAVHHSALRRETDSNYSIVSIWWDRLFGTYCAAPAKGLDDFDVGVEYFRSPRDLTLPAVLTMPFRLPKTATSPRTADSVREHPESLT